MEQFTRGLRQQSLEEFAVLLRRKLWAIMDGLKHAWSHGYRRVQIESDSQETVQQILNLNSLTISNGLTVAIREMLHRDWETLLRHVNRRAKALADWFARDMRDTCHDNNLFLEPCPAVLELLLHDLQQSLVIPDTGIK
ncbi:hypothetical protein GQ457_01G028910 [Hibiscus cannabinus]